MSDLVSASKSSEWLPTACILCECNCGIEIQLGGENGRRFTKVRAKGVAAPAHPRLTQGPAWQPGRRAGKLRALAGFS